MQNAERVASPEKIFCFRNILADLSYETREGKLGNEKIRRAAQLADLSVDLLRLRWPRLRARHTAKAGVLRDYKDSGQSGDCKKFM